jgi:predicted transposase YbfD/YdcC
MGETGGGSIVEHFGGLEDPRVERTKRHSLLAIITIALCEVICGADNWVEIAELGRAHLTWYASFLDLPYGIPSHDTFGRVFAALDPVQFEACFRAWVHALVQTLGPQVVALDGKALRGAHNAGEPPLQMVSAWASEARLVLAQRAVPEKANELSALPQVLQMLAVEGCIVTIDAMGTHAPIARQIVERGADYVLALKDNQERLAADVQALFADTARWDLRGIIHGYDRWVDGGHGRVEVRETWTIMAPDLLAYLDPQGDWPALRSVVMVRATRRLPERTTTEVRYYLSSLTGSARQIARAIRAHWGIENAVHWVLDLAFREDENRVRAGHAARNLSVLRHLALNLLRQERTKRVGIHAKRLIASADPSYLRKVLTG